MAEFTAAASLRVEVDQQSLTAARREIESAVPDPTVRPGSMVPDGGVTMPAGGGAQAAQPQPRDPETGQFASPMGTEEFERTSISLDEDRNEVLLDILDEVEDGGGVVGGGGGGGLPGTGGGGGGGGGLLDSILTGLGLGTGMQAIRSGGGAAARRLGPLALAASTRQAGDELGLIHGGEGEFEGPVADMFNNIASNMDMSGQELFADALEFGIEDVIGAPIQIDEDALLERILQQGVTVESDDVVEDRATITAEDVMEGGQGVTGAQLVDRLFEFIGGPDGSAGPATGSDAAGPDRRENERQVTTDTAQFNVSNDVTVNVGENVDTREVERTIAEKLQEFQRGLERDVPRTIHTRR